jgi:hypothetical protein
MLSRKLLVSTIAALASSPTLVSADSDIGVGGTGTTAQANLDFRIVIPDFVYFRVGTVGAGNVDRVDFNLATGLIQPGVGGNVAANGGVGDGADGVLTIELITNVASVDIDTDTGGGNLTSGANNIPFTKITETDGGVIPMPAFDTNATLSTGLPGSLSDTWSFTYTNDVVYPAGTYDGTVTYTVTTL